MLIVQVCVGSSCHMKGSQEIVELFQQSIAAHRLEDEVILTGSFCIGQCNRTGVTVQINDDIHTGITRDCFHDFFKTYILNVIEAERA